MGPSDRPVHGLLQPPKPQHLDRPGSFLNIDSNGKTGVGLGSPSTKSQPCPIEPPRHRSGGAGSKADGTIPRRALRHLAVESKRRCGEQGRWHSPCDASGGTRKGWRHHAPIAPKQSARTRYGRRFATSGSCLRRTVRNDHRSGGPCDRPRAWGIPRLQPCGGCQAAALLFSPGGGPVW